eukprot:1384444-Prymnesium_polylepis.1
MASGASYAQMIHIDSCCALQGKLVIQYVTETPFMSIVPCEREQGHCRLTFNDITLELSIEDTPQSPPTSPPSNQPAPPGTPHPVPSATDDGIPAVKSWAKDRVVAAERNFTGVRMPSPTHWEDGVVYEIMVDRFNNGDTSNDHFNLPAIQRERQSSSALSPLPTFRHGGDLLGITDRLGYFTELGIDAIYLTPVFGHVGTYHGYCTSDPTIVDPGFGTLEDLVQLVNASHARGIRVIMDLQVNHLCGLTARYTAPVVAKQECNNALFNHDKHGTAIDSSLRGNLDFGDGFFRPLDDQKFFARCGTVNIAAANAAERLFGDFSFGDENVDFTQAGDENAHFDFYTNDPDFQEIFTELTKYWIAVADIDGFRLDAVAHVTTS